MTYKPTKLGQTNIAQFLVYDQCSSVGLCNSVHAG